LNLRVSILTKNLIKKIFIIKDMDEIDDEKNMFVSYNGVLALITDIVQPVMEKIDLTYKESKDN
jgi:hypothetical protein